MLSALCRLRKIAAQLTGPRTFVTMFEDAVASVEIDELPGAAIASDEARAGP
jgi:hypothetical protein